LRSWRSIRRGPGQFRGFKLSVSVAIRQRDQVHRTTVFGLRAVPDQGALQHVPAVLCLCHWVDSTPDTLLTLLPNASLTANVTTLHLNHDPAGIRQKNDKIGLMLVPPLLQAQAVEEHRVIGQLAAQGVPDGALRTLAVAKERMTRNENRHTPVLPASFDAVSDHGERGGRALKKPSRPSPAMVGPPARLEPAKVPPTAAKASGSSVKATFMCASIVLINPLVSTKSIRGRPPDVPTCSWVSPRD
jgi:hypothetical protein